MILRHREHWERVGQSARTENVKEVKTISPSSCRVDARQSQVRQDDVGDPKRHYSAQCVFAIPSAVDVKSSNSWAGAIALRCDVIRLYDEDSLPSSGRGISSG